MLRFAAGLLLAAGLAAGEVHPAEGLEIRGVVSFPEADVRRAIASDLPLLLARRPGLASDTWRGELGRAVALGYRRRGFREATASITGSILTVVEGPITRCGALQLRVPQEVEAIVRRAMTGSHTTSNWDLDTNPRPEAVVWQEGAPLDWTAIDRYAEGLLKVLRHAGFTSSALTVQVQDPVAGAAALSVSLATVPTRVLLGQVRVAGLLPEEAGRLRRWLALPAEAPADQALVTGVEQRLRDSGAFTLSSANWEDLSFDFPGEMLRAIPVNEFLDLMNEDAAALQARVRQRGRADLLVTVQRVPGTAMPWDGEPSRERQAILAARARLLARFAGGGDLVAETGTPDGGKLLVVWSAAHGLAAIHRPPSGPQAVLALADGWLVSDGPAGRLRAPMLAPQCQFSLKSDAQDAAKQAISMQVSGLAPIPRLQLSLDPATCISLLLQPYGERPAQRSWDGEILLVSNGLGEWRLDPATGITLRRDLAEAGSVHLALAEGVWNRDIAPLIATARQPGQRPLGTVLAEGLSALRPAFPGLDDGLLRHALSLVRSGMLDGLAESLGGMANLDTTTSARFSIPLRKDRLPGASLMQLMPAMTAAACEGLLSTRLDDGAWPRVLLRSLVHFVCGDQRAAAAGLKPVVSGAAAGPLGCLAIGHVARFVGHEMLANILAEAGAARCDAAGLELEARLLSGLAPALLPAIAAEAESLAASASDAGRQTGLRALAAACTADGPAAARLQTAARLAADLGAGEWLRKRLQELLTPATAPRR